MSDTDGSIQVSNIEGSPVLRTLEIEVDVRRVGRAFDRAYRDLQRRVRVKGFRPGKAPRSVLERMYGAALVEDIERALVAETLPEALQQNQIEPVAEPSIDATPPSPDTPFRYTAHLEVKPPIELPDLQGLSAKKPSTEVSEADVLSELQGLQERNAPLLEEPEEKPIEMGHVVVLDYEGRIDGEAFEGGAGQGVNLEVGSERFLPGFEDQLLGARAGEDRQVRVSFPEDSGNPELAGKEALFQVHVSAVKRREIPDLDDAFAKDLGDFSSLEELRQRIRDDLGAARARVAEQELRQSLMDSAFERTAFDVPPAMVERHLQRRLALAHQELSRSVPEDALNPQLARWQEEWRPSAEREVRELLLLEAVAESQEIHVTDEELDAHIEELAQEEGKDPARLRKLYSEQGMREAVRGQLRDRRALDFLLAGAKVEETTGT